ncbi:hypothetical protein ACGTJS_11050 [Faucicola mancuniensis]|uniref:putative barnase/colicin E5 family endoribonuclease n=1 Tax=Faucicola mancuniensis TaxID=1309795 RepID=UPI003977C835
MFDLLNEIGKIPTNSLLQTYLDRQSAMFDSTSAMKSVVANIKRGEKAMTKALLDKTSVHRAMYLQGNDDFNGGWVDFEWGDVGRIRPNGKTKGGKGLSHIIEGRMRKDNMTYDEAVLFLTKNVPEAIAKGTIVEVEQDPNQEKVYAVILIYKKTKIAFRKAKGSNSWVISAYEMNRTGGAKYKNV